MTQETKTKAAFPSVEWFDAIREIVNDDAGYKHIGTCDALVGIKIPDLEKNYLLHLSGQPEKWVLTLLPSDTRIAALVQRITVTGSKNQIRSIEYLQADGDRSLLSIEPIEAK